MIEEKFVTWRGQIVDDTVWKDNLPAEKWKSSDEIPGWGTRYRVRIIGRDTETKEVSDSQLDWATLIYPVTAGSGHGGSYQTANLRKGAFVWGFYDDPEAKSSPVIVGCLSNVDQIQLAKTIPLSGFDPYSGYIKEQVAYHDIPSQKGDPTESNNKQLKNSVSDYQAYQKGKQEVALPVSSDCDKLQLGTIQIEIKNFIQDIQDFKNQINSWQNTILKPINENGQSFGIEEYIQYKVENVAKEITKVTKNIVTEVQGYVERKINAAMKDTYDFLTPDLRASAKPAVETANDLLACLFRKIISNLLGLIKRLLLEIAERFINAPLCAIENIVAGLLGKLTGLINSAVQAIMAPLNAILGVVDIAGDIIDFVVDILSFLSCEEQPSCPEVTAWSPWSGASQFNLGSDVTNILNKVKDYASNVQQSVDPDNFDFDFDFSDVFQDTCNVGPIFCGPPTVEFYGGGGSGAVGNVIISTTGDILGVDLLNSGSGYTSAPFVKFFDNCGNGKSASGRAVIGVGANGTAGIGTTSSYGVIKVIMDDPGSGYLRSPNGDRGGDGRTWAKSDQTTVKRNNGKYDRPYNPGEVISLNPGDELYSCGLTTLITESQTITAPQCLQSNPPIGKDPSGSNGEYPIIIELDDVLITNPGFDYDCGVDKIQITPDNGAVLEYECDPFGSISKVKVIKPGIGFTEYPDITIQTKTGYNAKFLPSFRVNRDVQGRDQGQIISVVDCVGRV